MKLFGFQITRDVEEENKSALPEPKVADGALEVDGYGSSYLYSTTFDFAVPADENKLITKYRDLALQPEFDRAIDDIVNEFFSYESNEAPITLNLDNVKMSDGIKEKIIKEFETLMNLLNFKENGYEIFRRWYIDGRLYYQMILNTKDQQKKGIKELRYIDPRKIRKVRQRKTDKPVNHVQGVEMGVETKEFYIYNPHGISHQNPTGIPLQKDSIAYIHSGLLSKDNRTVLSYIHKAIKFFNCLRQLEDSLVIYRIVRAPERRVFNIEVGDLPPRKAEEHVENEIKKFRKKLSFDPSSGNVNENKQYLTMLEDFWFPKRDGRGTDITSLQAGANLGEIEDVEYFKKKLYEALNVPYTRLDSQNTFNLGRGGEITRDELKFTMFISRLRKKFNGLFNELLKTQLLLKGIINEKEWNKIWQKIDYDYQSNNYFSELKQSDIWQNRFNMMNDASQNVGKFFSKLWIQQNILKLTKEEIDEMDKEIDKERKAAKEKGIPYGNEMPIDPNAPAPAEGMEGEEGDDSPPMGEETEEIEPIEELKPDSQELQETEKSALTIRKTVKHFGIDFSELDSSKAQFGPSLIRYRIKLQPGTKISQIEGLSRDIKGALGLKREPIIDYIPGETNISIDVARKKRKTVPFEKGLEGIDAVEDGQTRLPVAMGISPIGEIVSIDLAKLPHVLIAGGTKSGKTVFIHTMLLGWMAKLTPDQLEISIIDPKQTDFAGLYNGSPYLNEGKVITNPEEAIAKLQSLVDDEMIRRRVILKDAGFPNIEEYNAAMPEKRMKSIIMVIDEYNDLILSLYSTAKRKFESSVVRLAQAGRATGIHLVLATQRPTTDVITGNIKANMPVRVAFKTNSGNDSRVIIDQSGAQNLLGYGDMLAAYEGEVRRLQSFFVPTDEMKTILAQHREEYEAAIVSNNGNDGDTSDEDGNKESDEDVAAKARRGQVPKKNTKTKDTDGK